ncbi:hypothetical protein SAMN05216387_10943 [Nitrosovibrio tenuis]|uniref:Uncharacterized protein n=1 Tax=Nitrosovibrio tenuis TaxID=1233 RepID=A0A1H7PJ58_9PROT|nr:hypothetical protein SAMN05216387_10943 [Nitrosovibrio tenuis]
MTNVESQQRISSVHIYRMSLTSPGISLEKVVPELPTLGAAPLIP